MHQSSQFSLPLLFQTLGRNFRFYGPEPQVGENDLCSEFIVRRRTLRFTFVMFNAMSRLLDNSKHTGVHSKGSKLKCTTIGQWTGG